MADPLNSEFSQMNIDNVPFFFFSDGGYDFRYNTSIHYPKRKLYSTVSGSFSKQSFI